MKRVLPLKKQYKVEFFDCYDLLSVQTYHCQYSVFDILKNAAVQIVTLELAPAIRFMVDGVYCAEAPANNILCRYIREIDETYINEYYTKMEKEGRL